MRDLSWWGPAVLTCDQQAVRIKHPVLFNILSTTKFPICNDNIWGLTRHKPSENHPQLQLTHRPLCSWNSDRCTSSSSCRGSMLHAVLYHSVTALSEETKFFHNGLLAQCRNQQGKSEHVSSTSQGNPPFIAYMFPEHWDTPYLCPC